MNIGYVLGGTIVGIVMCYSFFPRIEIKEVLVQVASNREIAGCVAEGGVYTVQKAQYSYDIEPRTHAKCSFPSRTVEYGMLP